MTDFQEMDNLNEDDLSLSSDFNDICEELNNIKSTISSLTNKLKAYKKKIDKVLKEKGIEKEKEVKSKVKKTKEKVEKVEKEDKETKEEVKEKKVKKERKKKEEIVPPSAITEPILISAELQQFLSKPDNCSMTRLDITQLMYDYINKNNLQNLDDKKIINPDDNLKKLFNLNDNQVLTYFNIQSMINKHFILEKKDNDEE